MDEYDDEEDIDGSEEREALSMVLANLGDSVKGMRRKRMSKPVKAVEIGEVAEVDPLAESDVELTPEEISKLEELC